MKSAVGILTLMTVAAISAGAADTPPGWAYGFEPGPAVPAVGGSGARGGARGPQAPDNTTLHLEGSTLEFTRTQVNDGFGPADWFPGDHPKMPEIVAHGRRPDIRACALCHYPNGQGRAENAAVNGFPVEYFLQQLKDFGAGNRKSADSRKQNTAGMAAIAKAMTDEERQAAAEYFAAIPFKPWVKVVESKTAPKTRTNVGLFLPLPGNETEPLGDRIIEVPVSVEMTETYRNPRSGFIAYAPLGSIKKGRALAKTAQCTLCHGPELKGVGPVPAIAGRSPSYMMRQMYDMQQGTRKGLWTPLMKPVVANRSQDELLDLAAYVASLNP